MAKEMKRARMAFRSIVGVLAVLAIVAFVVGSAFAFPTPGTEVTIVNSIGVISGAQIEQIHVNGNTTPTSVYMGPYKIPIPTNGSTVVELMMCFNAGAMASGGKFIASNTLEAPSLFTSDPYAQAKVNMIAWLASLWQSPAEGGTKEVIAYNANINKAMWEIWADYAPGIDLTVNGSAGNPGTFFLNGPNSVVDQLVLDALGHSLDTSTAANFLIPVIKDKTGAWVYDPSRQPFAAPVPEPGTLLLLGSGLVGLGLHGWRKRSKAQK